MMVLLASLLLLGYFTGRFKPDEFSVKRIDSTVEVDLKVSGFDLAVPLLPLLLSISLLPRG